MNLFASRLKELRKDHKETQDSIAKLLHVGRSTVGEYERGNIRPPMDKMKILADHFEVSVDYLMGNTNFQTLEERSESAPTDAASVMKQLLEDLQKNHYIMMFEGHPVDKTLREFLISTLDQALKVGKTLTKT